MNPSTEALEDGSTTEVVGAALLAVTLRSCEMARIFRLA